jgi:tetratricopeptide (TPR) repeat protein
MTGFGNARKKGTKKVSSKDLQSLIEQAVTLHQSGNLQDAETLYCSAIRRGVRDPAIFANLGVIYKQTNRPAEAIRAYKKAISIDPTSSDAYLNLGSITNEQGDTNTAILYTRKSLQINPANSLALHNLGVYLKQQNQLDLAFDATLQSLRLNPNYGPAHLSLGLILIDLNQPEKALPAILASLHHMPGHLPGLLALATVYKDLGQYNKASEVLHQALQIDPCSSNAYCNLGVLLYMQDKLDEAVEVTLCAISLNSANAMAHRSLAAIYRDRGELADALSAAHKAVALAPNDAIAHMNLGSIYSELCMFTEAESSTAKSIQLKPDYTCALFNLSQLQLLRNDYEHGWRNYAFRAERTVISSLQNGQTCELKQWSGDEGDHVLVVGDQGLGDQILSVSMIGQMQQRCSHISLKVDHRLVPILKRSFHGNIDITTQDKLLVDGTYESYLSLGDLGQHLRHDLSAFGSHPRNYLIPDQERVSAFKLALGNHSRQVLGLSWNSIGSKYYNRKKSIPLRLFADHLKHLDAEFVSLQYGDVSSEIASVRDTSKFKISHIPALDATNDIDRLAALIYACDAVITISNVTAHLAGALGKETHLLVPASPHFYWGLQSQSTVWYPSIKIYRQSRDGSWAHALDQLSSAIG